jgi:hypothetical protein
MNTKLPRTDEKYLDFCEDEIIVLKSEFDDSNIKRLYQVLTNDGKKLSIKVLSEIDINSKQQLKCSNRIFESVDKKYFQPFM